MIWTVTSGSTRRDRRLRGLSSAVALLALLLSLALVLPASAVEPPERDFTDQVCYRVTRVIDGDTLELVMGGREVTVRLIGIDTPERAQRGRDAEPFSREATEVLRRLCGGTSVYLEYDPLCARKDRYGRTLAHLFRAPDGLWINLEMVRSGMSAVYDKYPFSYADLFRAGEAEAREAKLGRWSEITSTPTGSPNDDAARDGDIVYVTPSGHSYHVRDCPNLRRGGTAVTRAEAEGRGLRPCGNCRP